LLYFCSHIKKVENTLITYIAISAVSLAVLLLASDWFIESAEKIGLSFGISPFVIGVTIVAFGTSLPELAASIASVYSGTSEIVVGNVVGSNITNILLVLGLTCMVGKSINLDFDLWDVDMPLLLGSSFLMYFILQDGQLALIESLLFLAALVGFLINSVASSVPDEDVGRPTVGPKDIAKLIAGGVLVYFGAKYTIYGIEGVSMIAGISPEVISLTFVALGTSLPEVVVSIAAAKRGKHAIAVGNVLGSNIFNTYAVMAIPSLLGELYIPENVISFGLPFMVAMTVMFGAMTFSRKICKWEGFLLLIFYAYYLAQQFCNV
jgi:cation:H+ antiporter